MTRIIDFAAPVGQKAGPGHWNDLDMLEIGNGGMSSDEYSECMRYSSLNTRSNAGHSDSFLDVEHPQESVDSG